MTDGNENEYDYYGSSSDHFEGKEIEGPSPEFHPARFPDGTFRRLPRLKSNWERRLLQLRPADNVILQGFIKVGLALHSSI